MDNRTNDDRLTGPMSPAIRPPDVAVIIPAYNAAGFLDQTLATVAGQTLQPAVVMIADDASSDDTVERAQAWRGRLPIQVLRLERNVGPAAARHQAILATDVPVLALLDADDLWFPDHLETMVAAYLRVPGLVSAQEYSWMPGRGVDTSPRRLRAKKGVLAGPEQLTTLLQRNYINFPLFPRELYDRVGGFREQFLVGEDWDLWIRMLRSGAALTEASHPTALHRERPHSLSADLRRNGEFGIAVLSAALEEAGSTAEREAAERGLRALRARQRYFEASGLALAGHPWRARLEAARGWTGGGPRLSLVMAALTVAPRMSLRAERSTRRYRVFMTK
jgi:hypothetical protein